MSQQPTTTSNPPPPSLLSYSRGSTTEPNTPESQVEPEQLPSYIFARLIPINKAARTALDATVALEDEDAKHHQQFIKQTLYDGERINCFELSLTQLPRFPKVGWVLGKGRRNLPHHGVDLLLTTDRNDEVAGVHARFAWVRGAGGFFLIADNKRGKKVMMNGERFATDRRTIPLQNAIMIGECVFTLEYVQRDIDEEEQFQVELAAFYRKFHDDESPLVTAATPSENDTTFGEWRVSYTISRGTFGVVYMVTHAHTGQPAAAKQIFKTAKNRYNVERELTMARLISHLSHPHLASPFSIRQHKSRTKAEITRIRSLLDDAWDPAAFNITSEYIILSPLLTATFRSLYTSTLTLPARTVFFAQLLAAISFLHAHGITHRDIKPDNILVRSYSPPCAMLADFGCAASTKEPILYDWPGTVPYLAPEQVEGEYHGAAVDLWAAALVGFELLGGPRVAQRVLPGARLEKYTAWRGEGIETSVEGQAEKGLEVKGEVKAKANPAPKSEPTPQARANTMLHCCRAMLKPIPSERMSAEEARSRIESATLSAAVGSVSSVGAPIDAEIGDAHARREEMKPPPQKRRSGRRGVEGGL